MFSHFFYSASPKQTGSKLLFAPTGGCVWNAALRRPPAFLDLVFFLEVSRKWRIKGVETTFVYQVCFQLMTGCQKSFTIQSQSHQWRPSAYGSAMRKLRWSNHCRASGRARQRVFVVKPRAKWFGVEIYWDAMGGYIHGGTPTWMVYRKSH